MKKVFLSLLLFLPVLVYSQTDHLEEFYQADSLIQIGEVEKGYLKLKQLELKVAESDTLYSHIIGYQYDIVSFFESNFRMNEDFENSLEYGLEALDLIEKIYGEGTADPFMIKNIIVSYSGLKRYDEAQEYRDWLYAAYDEKVLPEGIDEYFNFDYFKWEDKNIWGYEWFEKLPENRFSSSFTKVVYYVYSTNDDGSDKDQLYRLHVLMFHGDNESFDYVMTKRLDTATNEVSGTFYAYTYKEDIDFEKLHNDVIEILKGNFQPDTKSTRSNNLNEDGKIEVHIEMNMDE